MNGQTRKALIIGCGIGGPAVAPLLTQVGVAAESYEARTTSEGYSLSLSCNGVAVLKMLSFDEPAFAEGSPVSKWSMWNGKGKHLEEALQSRLSTADDPGLRIGMLVQVRPRDGHAHQPDSLRGNGAPGPGGCTPHALT